MPVAVFSFVIIDIRIPRPDHREDWRLLRQRQNPRIVQLPSDARIPPERERDRFFFILFEESKSAAAVARETHWKDGRVHQLGMIGTLREILQRHVEQLRSLFVAEQAADHCVSLRPRHRLQITSVGSVGVAEIEDDRPNLLCVAGDENADPGRSCIARFGALAVHVIELHDHISAIQLVNIGVRGLSVRRLGEQSRMQRCRDREGERQQQ